jgi:serine/threonine protein kinase
MSAIENQELCSYIDEERIINFGMSATVYKIDDYIIKEIYIRKKLATSPKLNEYYINELILTNKELQKYTIKYYGASECPPTDKRISITLLLKFEYIPFDNLYTQITELKLSDFIYIFKKIRSIMSLFNKEGITHNDLNSKNIFYNPDNKKVLIGDWGEGKIENRIEDIDFWQYNVIKNELIFSYFLKNTKYENFTKFLKSTKLGEDRDGFKSSDSLFYYFKKSVNAKVKQRLYNNYKPDFFNKNLESLTTKYVLEGMMSIEVYRKYVVKNSKIPNDIKNFFKV